MGKKRYALVTLVPLLWLTVVTFPASYQKIFSPNPRIGFLAHARQLTQAAIGQQTAEVARLILDDRIDVVVTGLLVILAAALLVNSGVVWLRAIRNRNPLQTHEAPFVATQWNLTSIKR